MKPHSFLLGVAASALVAVSLPAQEAPADPLRTRARAMHRAALREGQSWDILKSLCTTAPRRLSGSPGDAAAIAWAEATMRRIGLENVRSEEITVPVWVRGDVCDVRIQNGDGTSEPLRALALGGSIPTRKGGIRAPVLEVQTFAQLRKLGEQARGRIVFCNRPFAVDLTDTFNGYGRTVDQRSQGAIEAAKVGAVACVIRSVTTAVDDEPHTGMMRYGDDVEKVPAAALSIVAADRLSALLKDHPDLELQIELNCQTLPDGKSANVIGDLVGRELPEEIVIVSGHRDAWDVGQGAHDDGAGSTHALEAARLIRATGPPPRRTVRVILWGNEENGLRGGQAYARTHQAALHRHVLAIESDRGGFAPRGFTVTGGQAVIEALAPIEKLLGVLDLGDLRPGHGGADISPLGPFGVPLMGLRPDSARYFDFHHSEKDVLEAVNPRELALGAAALAIMSYAVAEQEHPLPRPIAPRIGGR